MVTKICNSCGFEKELNTDNFYFKNKKYPEKGFHPECKECAIKRSRKWWIKNEDKAKEMHKKYRQSDKYKSWNRKNGIKQKDNKKIWKVINKDKIKEYNLKHQQKRHKISTVEWEACKKYFNHRCAYCGLVIEEHWIERNGKFILGDFHKEHVVDDGANDLSNCVPSCKSCNSSKREYTLEEWYNESNPNFSQERLDKINKWKSEDYKKFIKSRF